MALELDMSSCQRIFHLLDSSGDGMLEAHEFVEGCIEQRGFARKVDITLLQREFNAIMLDLQKNVANLAGEIKHNREASEIKHNRDGVKQNRHEGRKQRDEVKKNHAEVKQNQLKPYKVSKEQPNRPVKGYSAMDEENEIEEMLQQWRANAGSFGQVTQ